MEREALFTGVGGQSVQLAAQILARAAAREGRHVTLLGTYGGTMRGGNTDSCLVVGEAPLSTPPIVSRAWSAIVMHHAFFEPLRAKLAPDAVVVLNASLFEGSLDLATHRVFEVPATAIATDLGSPLAASLVLTSSYAGLTDLVGVESLVEAMRESVPSYRRQHLEANERALRAGFEVLPRSAAPAFTDAGRAA